MKYLWDTDICVSFLRGRDHSIVERLLQIDPFSVLICSVVRAELVFGAFRSSRPKENLEKVRDFLSGFGSVPFDDRAAEVYGEIRAHLSEHGLVIGPNDLLIAAIALAHGMTLVTHNTREFERVRELNLEDWAV